MKTRYLLVVMCLVLAIVAIFKIYHLDTNPKILDVFARYYFDQDYYLKNYPEVEKTGLSPFDHYSKQGWLEGKNPNPQFDTRLYQNLYPHYKKYQLNPLQHYVRSKLSLEKIYTNSKHLKKATLLKSPQYYLALVAIFQNEARFLKEWIEFYRLIGVEHFYLYNHLSTDNYDEVLAPYIKNGIVELRDITSKPSNLIEWNALQTSIYSAVANQVKDKVEWLVVVDTDEYLFPVQEQNLAHVLKNYDDYASLSVNWRLFGSNGVSRIAPKELLIEKLTKAAALGDNHVKTIVKPRYVKKFLNPHFPLLQFGYAQVTENKEYFFGPFSPNQSLQFVRINHYWSRDLEFFNNNKLARVHVLAYDLSEEQKKLKLDKIIAQDRSISEEYDNSITKYIKDLRARLQGL